MALNSKDQAAELLEKIIARVDNHFFGVESAQIKSFIQYFYHSVTPEEILAWGDSANLYHTAIFYWHWIRQYSPHQPKVQVYNPQLEPVGWQSSYTIVSILVKDQPFLVDSLQMALNRQGLRIHLGIYLTLKTYRDEQGQLVDIFPSDSNKLISPESIHAESLIHIAISKQTEPLVLITIAQELERVLTELRLAVDDWQLMRNKIGQLLQELENNSPPLESNEIKEVRDFLQWVQAKHFIFLGYRQYQLAEENHATILRRLPGTGLGILRDQAADENGISHSFAQLSPPLRQLAYQPHLLVLTKTATRSTIHRPVCLDYIGVKQINSEGQVIGEHRFLGLYTSAAYHQRIVEIPIICRKVMYVLEQAGYPRNSHQCRNLLNILETYPRDELFQIEPETLLQTVISILQLREHQQLRLLVRTDLYQRFFSCLVYVPRERFDTQICQRIQAILLKTLGGIQVEFKVWLSESTLALVHFIIYTPRGSYPPIDLKAIEQQLIAVTRSWNEFLYEALLERHGEEQGTSLFNRYAAAFPVAYQADSSALDATNDINNIEQLTPANDLNLSWSRPLESVNNALRLKLFHTSSYLPLTDILPRLEKMGLKVMNERSYLIQIKNRQPVWIQELSLLHSEPPDFNLEPIQDLFQTTFIKVWRGEIENDGFNRLVLRAQLNWRAIVIFRAYWKYLRQIGNRFSQDYVEQVLVNHAKIIQLFFELFIARHHPNQMDTDKANSLIPQIEKLIDSVTRLDEDRILRQFFSVILATLRTNYFQRDPQGEPKPYLAFKLDPQKILELPAPRPQFEIFVYSPRMEGVHLRGGKVARGGIRWSERLEDFRTEILGLLKAQMVKNAVIVPVGAKGGFVTKQLPTEGGTAAIRAEGIACYQWFIRGLLDLTDNLVGGQVVPPADIVCYDDDDPYLVVAADKGTATFSDIANQLAQAYHFWLGDAFASGGSSGYDHKKMGITAKGTWKSVKRHGHELNLDIETQDFTVIGIGDMSGDVFGNGLLLSKHIQLVAAFNHLHIFLDPHPEPQRSWPERQRLFNLPHSTWADYDTRLISTGGGVFSRQLKFIELSPQMQARLDTPHSRLTPNELIRAILCAPVDLLWNGGIGTYVKAQAEYSSTVGDRANDAVRVNGQELRCRIVAEGGNLGFTQRGRIEYALQGGRIYTDAIDNSGGVACSDQEVNIKILLNAIVANGDITTEQRQQLLAEMTEAVTLAVLKHNELQTQLINQTLTIAPQLLDLHSRLLRHLEKSGQLDRELEFLPNNKILAERRAAQQGLTAPELCVLLAYSKMTLYKELLNSTLPDDPDLEPMLLHYFPSPLPERYEQAIIQHRLRREIITTELTNQVINRGGMALVFGLNEETGQPNFHIVRAFLVANGIFDIPTLWHEIESLDNQINAPVHAHLLTMTGQHLERATRWLLLQYHQMPLAIAATIALFRPGVTQLTEHLFNLIGAAAQTTLTAAIHELVTVNVPLPLATQVASLVYLLSALDIITVAKATSIPLETVAALYFQLGEHLQLHWLRDRISELPRDNRWTALSRSALREELYRTHREITTLVLITKSTLESAQPKMTPQILIDTWLTHQQLQLERYQQVLAELTRVAQPDLAMLSVALRQLRKVYE